MAKIVSLKVEPLPVRWQREASELLGEMYEEAKKGAFDTVVIVAKRADAEVTVFASSGGPSASEQIGMLERMKARILQRDLED